MKQDRTDARARHLVVIGGGVGGLTAAFTAAELARAGGRPLQVTLVESTPRHGGLVGTERIAGHLVDLGADSFITNKPAGIRLCEQLELIDQLTETATRFRGALVLKDGRTHRVPDGFNLMTPSAVGPILRTPLLSLRGKLRLLREAWVPPAELGLEESLSQFANRRLGPEAFERLVQPLVGGIYTSDPDLLSLDAALPRFRADEQQHGSLMRAAFRRARQGQTSERATSGARYGLFAGFREGMQQLIDRLRERLHEAGVEFRHTRVREIAPVTPSGYRLLLDDGSLEADVVIVATAAWQGAELLSGTLPGLASALNEIPYASSVIVVSGHRTADIAHPLDAFGLVIPRREQRQILAVSFAGRKFPDRVPDGETQLRTFVGGALQPELASLPDDRLEALVRDELRSILGVTGTPTFLRVVRYPRAMPQYHLGHRERVRRIETLLASSPGLYLAGNAYHGVGLPDTIESAQRAAEKAVREISLQQPVGGPARPV